MRQNGPRTSFPDSPSSCPPRALACAGMLLSKRSSLPRLSGPSSEDLPSGRPSQTCKSIAAPHPLLLPSDPFIPLLPRVPWSDIIWCHLPFCTPPCSTMTGTQHLASAQRPSQDMTQAPPVTAVLSSTPLHTLAPTSRSCDIKWCSLCLDHSAQDLVHAQWSILPLKFQR